MSTSPDRAGNTPAQENYDPGKDPKGRGTLLFVGAAASLFAALFLAAWLGGGL